jgi:hypothetical protein
VVSILINLPPLLLLLLHLAAHMLLHNLICCRQAVSLPLPLPLLPSLLCSEAAVINERVTLLHCKLLHLRPREEDMGGAFHHLEMCG